MTDKEELLLLLTRFGVGFEEEKSNKVICRQGRTKIGGYSGFETIFEFDEQGKFEKMGAWE